MFFISLFTTSKRGKINVPTESFPSNNGSPPTLSRSLDLDEGLWSDFEGGKWRNISSPAAQDLLRRLLVLEPQRRLSAEEALQHDWFQVRLRGVFPLLLLRLYLII